MYVIFFLYLRFVFPYFSTQILQNNQPSASHTHTLSSHSSVSKCSGLNGKSKRMCLCPKIQALWMISYL